MGNRSTNILPIQATVETDALSEGFKPFIGAGLENTASGGAFHGSIVPIAMDS